MITIPCKWHSRLLELQQYNPRAILAGGAIRDLICGKRVRDLDFFIVQQPGKDLCRLRNLMLHWGWIRNDFTKFLEYDTGNIGENPVYKVWFIKPYLGLPSCMQTTINVILCDGSATPLELIEKFDFGLCMVAYDGTEIIRSRHFERDLENKVFTLRRAVDPVRVQKSVARYKKKFRWKYGWPMELSGQARLDQILAGLHAKGPQIKEPLDVW